MCVCVCVLFQGCFLGCVCVFLGEVCFLGGVCVFFFWETRVLGVCFVLEEGWERRRGVFFLGEREGREGGGGFVCFFGRREWCFWVRRERVFGEGCLREEGCFFFFEEGRSFFFGGGVLVVVGYCGVGGVCVCFFGCEGGWGGRGVFLGGGGGVFFGEGVFFGGREGLVRVFFCGQVGKSVLLLTFSKNVLVRLRCFLSVGVVKTNRRKRHSKRKVPRNRSEMQIANNYSIFAGLYFLCGFFLKKKKNCKPSGHICVVLTFSKVTRRKLFNNCVWSTCAVRIFFLSISHEAILCRF